MWTLKRNDTNELIYKTDADSQTYRTNFWLTEEEFKEIFYKKDILECIEECTSPSKELIFNAFESFLKTELNKPFYNYKDDNSIEFDFYFQLQWNFNHFGNSVGYIEKM